MKAIDYEEESTKRGNWLDITGGTAKDSLTVLDYFAGKALVGGLHADVIEVMQDESLEGYFEAYAEFCYRIAEAMLAERNKRFTPQNVVKGVTGKTYG